MQKVTKTIAALVAFGMAFALPASAETFSFTSSGEPTGGIEVPMPDGNNVTAGTSAGTTTWTWASGKSSTSTYVCHVMSQRPGEMFNVHGVCDSSEDGKISSSVLFGCNYTNAEKTQSNCVGGLIGRGGQFEGKSGTISWHGSPEGSVGAGQWTD